MSSKERITFSTSVEMKNFLKEKADEEGVSLNVLCFKIMKEYMRTQLLLKRQRELYQWKEN